LIFPYACAITFIAVLHFLDNLFCQTQSCFLLYFGFSNFCLHFFKLTELFLTVFGILMSICKAFFVYLIVAFCYCYYYCFTIFFLLFYHFYIYLLVYTLFGSPPPYSKTPLSPSPRFWAEPVPPFVL
jgi:hypothetical protein